MVEPVKIYDLAKKMISLSGYVPGKDIKIEITGLRPGEKLYEELLGDREALQPTHNKKILIGKIIKYDLQIANEITDLLVNINELERQELVEYLMRIVPEFVSKNSHYSLTDDFDSNTDEYKSFISKKARKIVLMNQKI